MDLDRFAEDLIEQYNKKDEEDFINFLLDHKDELKQGNLSSPTIKDREQQHTEYSNQPVVSTTPGRGNTSQDASGSTTCCELHTVPVCRHHAKQQDAQHAILPSSTTGQRSTATHPTRSTFSCYHCGSDAILDDRLHGDHVCTVCGTCSKYISDDGEICLPFPELGLARANAQMQLSKNCYKRINYFSELINQLIGQQQSRLPDWLIPKMRELLADRDPEDITGPVVREAMSLMKMGRYYEHAHLIANALNSNYNLVPIDHRHHSMMMSMFKRIQRPFELHKGRRKNFLNYQFILWQFFHILGIPQNCESLTMLRCKKRLVNQDKLWRVICEEAKLPYISVIDVLFPKPEREPGEAPSGGVRKRRANKRKNSRQ